MTRSNGCRLDEMGLPRQRMARPSSERRVTRETRAACTRSASPTSKGREVSRRRRWRFGRRGCRAPRRPAVRAARHPGGDLSMGSVWRSCLNGRNLSRLNVRPSCETHRRAMAMKQQSLDLRTWGGPRSGPGRKTGRDRRDAHLSRKPAREYADGSRDAPRWPVRLEPRSARSILEFHSALRGAQTDHGLPRPFLHPVGNHVHLIVEAGGHAASRAAFTRRSARPRERDDGALRCSSRTALRPCSARGRDAERITVRARPPATPPGGR